MSHLPELALWDCSSHFIMHQKVAAVKREDIAYTSPSTAENQNESEKVYASDPINPEDKISIISSVLISWFLIIIFLLKAVIVQKRKSIVNEEHSAESVLIATATSLVPGVANRLNILPKSWNNGAPGGWPTSNL